MPIDEEFSKNHHTIGKHKHADVEHYYFVWGLGKSDANTSTNPDVQAAYKEKVICSFRHSWYNSNCRLDSCYTDGVCIETCPV